MCVKRRRLLRAKAKELWREEQERTNQEVQGILPRSEDPFNRRHCQPPSVDIRAGSESRPHFRNRSKYSRRSIKATNGFSEE